MSYKLKNSKKKEKDFVYNLNSPTRLIYKEGKGEKIVESKKPLFYEGKPLAEVDYTETTAWSNFCKIRFKGSDEYYWIPSYRLEI